MVEARETRQFNDQPPSESSNDLASLAQNSRTLEQKLSRQDMKKSGQTDQISSDERAESAVNQHPQGQSAGGGQHDQGESGAYSQGLQGQSTEGRSNQKSTDLSDRSGITQADEAGNRDSQNSDATLVPVEPSQLGNSESQKHDTTIHRTVKPAVVHETIRPVETNIVTTNMTVHHHIHHYVHRIQPVIISSDEEERWVHDFMGQGMQPSSEGTMYRQMGDQGGPEKEVGLQGRSESVESGGRGYSHSQEESAGYVRRQGTGENVGRVGKHTGDGACIICGSSGNALKGTEGGKTHNGGICRVCRNDDDETLARGVLDMKISGSSRRDEVANLA